MHIVCLVSRVFKLLKFTANSAITFLGLYIWVILVRADLEVELVLHRYSLFIAAVLIKTVQAKITFSDIIVVDRPSNFLRFSARFLFTNTALSTRFWVLTHTNDVYGLVSLSSLFKGFNWSEREVWDLFGIFFHSHPDLRRILTDYGFSGHPLRKDFPLTGFSEVFFNDGAGSVVSNKLELSQSYRVFRLNVE